MAEVVMLDTETEEKKKTTQAINRLRNKIIIILSVCLTIEAFLCVCGRREKTDWPTNWQLAAAPGKPTALFYQKERKSEPFFNKQVFATVYSCQSAPSPQPSFFTP